MDKDMHLKELMSLLDGADQDIKKDADKQVEIEQCIDIKNLRDFKVSCSYRDIVFIICILKEYVKLTEEREGFTWEYYRNQFSELADRLSEQIEYDYDMQMEKCQKKMGTKDKSGDVGEDAMALAIKRKKKKDSKGVQRPGWNGAMSEDTSEEGKPLPEPEKTHEKRDIRNRRRNKR